MGFFGAMGRALKAPVTGINRAVGAVPGMNKLGGAINKAPGMSAMGGAMGIGPSPQRAPSPSMNGLAQAGAGIGNAFLQNRPQPAPMPGNNNVGQPGMSDNPQPMNEPQSMKSGMIQSEPMYGGGGGGGGEPQAMQDMSQMYGAPQFGAQAEGIGPSPEMAPPPPPQQPQPQQQMRRPMRPQRYGRMM